MREDPRIAMAHQVPMLELVDRLAIGGLVRTGGELVGPCPGCGGKDRFSINPRKDVIFCRRCDAKGDQIALVQLVLGLDFPAALDWLVGPRQELTPQQLAEQERKAEDDLCRGSWEILPRHKSPSLMGSPVTVLPCPRPALQAAMPFPQRQCCFRQMKRMPFWQLGQRASCARW